MIFTFADDNKDFGALKEQGKSKVILRITPKIEESIKAARDFGLDVIVYTEANSVHKTTVVTDFVGRINYEEDEISYVSVEDLENLKKRLKGAFDEISGFLIPIPYIKKPIYNEEMEKLCGFGVDCDELLYELFDGEKEISTVRSWYYSNLEKYVVNTYMKPQEEFLGKIEKRAIFDVGKAEIPYDLARRMVNPISLSKKGFIVALRLENEEDYKIFSRHFPADKTENSLLVVKPARGVMERYIQGEAKSKPNRLETPAIVAAMEGEYLCDMLKKSGYSYDVADEFLFDGREEFTGYENILICNSCLFTKDEMEYLGSLKSDRIMINSEELLRNVWQKGE